MSTAITLWCDGDAKPRCRAEFGPYLRAPSEVRKMAAGAGWTSRSMPGLSRYQRFRERTSAPSTSRRPASDLHLPATPGPPLGSPVPVCPSWPTSVVTPAPTREATLRSPTAT